jgi:hypothetical protein
MAVAVAVAVAAAVAVAVVKATPNPLPSSKVQLWDLHRLSVLALVKVMVMGTAKVIFKVTESPLTTL